jgi:hypothetical protein
MRRPVRCMVRRGTVMLCMLGMVRHATVVRRLVARMLVLGVVVTCHALEGAPHVALRASNAAGCRPTPLKKQSVEPLAPARRKWQWRV